MIPFVLVGLARMAWAWRRSFLLCFVGWYALMLLIAPVSAARYLWPLYPILAATFVLGVATAARAVRPAMSEAHRGMLALACTALIVVGASIQIAIRPAPPTLLGDPDVRSLFAELRAAHAREPVRASFVNPRVLTWETGIPAMAAVGETEEEVIGELDAQRISHVVVGALGEHAARVERIEAVMRRWPERFLEVYRNPTFTVYRFAGSSP
jgi:hypothetical protein